VVVERRAEAVQEGDGSESRVGGGAGGNRYACRSAQQSLDLGKRFDRASKDCSLVILTFRLGRGHVDPGRHAPQYLELCVQSIATQ
jgi:hypothetical protein